MRQPLGPLAHSIVGLAGTPDDAADIGSRLATIARLAADTLTPISYASITAWPGLSPEAAGLGMDASLSIPLFAGSGATIAVLNLYGLDAVAMIPLTARVGAVYEADVRFGPEADQPFPDGACADLIAGLVEAFAVLAVIQRAVGVVMAAERCTAEIAYLSVRLRASETGTSLTAVAAALLK